jgi:urea transport system permease protein
MNPAVPPTFDAPDEPFVGPPADAADPAARAPRKGRVPSSVDARLPLAAAPIDPTVQRVRRAALVGVVGLFFLVVPLLNYLGVVPDYKLNFLGKYLCFAIVALGIDLIWGYTGLLSLSQALFFCLGGYAMAMHLSLPQGGGIYDVPQFLSYVYYGKDNPLPPFWRPFTSLPFAVAAGIFVPALVASVFGFFIFRSRVRGVYFSIITQAVAWGSWLLISRHEMLLGGTNGLTNFSKSLTQEKRNVASLYLLTVTVLALSYLLCRALTRSRLGRVLVAVRDRESRLYFAGYKPYAFKVFAFTVAAVLAGVGGMLYSPQVTIISPHNMRVEESILMVIWVALGGRGRLWGAIYGTLLVNYTYAALTSDMPAVWPFIQGAMFLAVVLFFPDGFVGLWDKVEEKIASRAGFVPVVLAALPVVLMALFVLAEALGLMPTFLQTVVFRLNRVGAVQLKYLVILSLLVATGAYHYATRNRPAASGARGCPLADADADDAAGAGAAHSVPAAEGGRA